MEAERGGTPLDLAERIDRRRLDEVRDRPREIAIGRDEDVSLQLRQGHELGVVRRLPTQLIRDPPGRSLQHLVAEETHPQGVDPRDPLEPVGRGDLTPPGCLIQRRQRLRADERRRDELVTRRDLDLAGRDPEHVSQSTTNRVTPQTLHPDSRLKPSS